MSFSHITFIGLRADEIFIAFKLLSKLLCLIFHFIINEHNLEDPRAKALKLTFGFASVIISLSN